MPRIRFVQSVTVEQGDGKGQRFKAGEEFECEQPSRDYWIFRGVAVDISEPIAPADTGAAALPRRRSAGEAKPA